jgi:hypothetical protein
MAIGRNLRVWLLLDSHLRTAFTAVIKLVLARLTHSGTDHKRKQLRSRFAVHQI